MVFYLSSKGTWYLANYTPSVQQSGDVISATDQTGANSVNLAPAVLEIVQCAREGIQASSLLVLQLPKLNPAEDMVTQSAPSPPP